jgi:hypothetical protein
MDSLAVVSTSSSVDEMAISTPRLKHFVPILLEFVDAFDAL